MPVILPAGCRVCGSGRECLSYDSSGELYCVKCKQKEDEMFDKFKNEIRRIVNDACKNGTEK